MHAIANNLRDFDCLFTPFYVDGFWELCRRMGLIEFTIAGQRWRSQCLSYLRDRGLDIDFGGQKRAYDLVVSCTDLFVPRNVVGAPGVLVQEGMTDPENLLFHLVKRVRAVPRFFASTAATGLSHWYERFCVASQGYRDLFARKGVDPKKMVVTGIPNFDDCSRYVDNDFPHRGHVLVCTSDARETFKLHRRRPVIDKALRLAGGRRIIFKLHPNENVTRATREIARLAPGALVLTAGCTEHMIANCDILITEFSSTAFVGLALGKEVHSEFPLADLERLLPLQNRAAAHNIAGVCREVLQ
ncbi:MAG TPA: hypothetical protein VJT73_16395 [Polyangiaceae bacterium]|nr:hypothetical protein [Polyangiaceae bacterium]